MLDLPEKILDLWEKIIDPQTNVVYKVILIFAAISYFFKHPRTRVRAIVCFLLFSLVIVLYHFEYLETPLYLLIPLIYGVISLYIVIAYYYFSQNKKEEAKEYYEKFKLAKESIEHYVIWLKIYDEILEKEFC